MRSETVPGPARTPAVLKKVVVRHLSHKLVHRTLSRTLCTPVNENRSQTVSSARILHRATAQSPRRHHSISEQWIKIIKGGHKMRQGGQSAAVTLAHPSNK